MRQRLRGYVVYGIEGRDVEFSAEAMFLPPDHGLIRGKNGEKYTFSTADLVNGVAIPDVMKGQRVAFNDVVEPSSPLRNSFWGHRRAVDVQPAAD